MRRETIEWAIDVARVLRQRQQVVEELSTGDRTASLMEILLAEPPPTSWESVIRAWMPQRGKRSASDESLQRQVRRVRDLLSRAAAGLNPDNMKGAISFQNRTRAQNMLVLGQILSDSGYHRSSIVSVESALRIAVKYELPDVALRALSLLRLNAATSGDRRAAERLSTVFDTTSAMLNIALTADTLLSEASLLLFQYTDRRQDASTQILKILDRLEQLASQPHAPAIVNVYRFRILIWHATLRGDATALRDTGTEALDFLDRHSHVEHTALRAEFLGSRLSAMLVVGDTNEAEQIWDDAQSLVTEGGNAWSTLLHVYFLVCSTQGAYVQARDAVLLYQSRRKDGPRLLRDHKWSICRAYMMLLIDTGRLEAGPFEHRPGEYLATIELPHRNNIADKSISGAALFILRVLQWIRSNNRSKILANEESIRQYASRYLNNPNTLRTGVFLRMLATLPAADFDPAVVQKRAQAILMKHSKAARLIRDYAEIVPYNELWSIVIETLEQKGTKRST